MNKLQNIEEKIRKLIEVNSKLRQENEKLCAQNEAYEKELATQKENNANLEQLLQETRQQLSEKGGTSLNTQEIKEQLDQYIQEIDTCIDWLSNI